MLESIGPDDLAGATGGRALVGNDPLEGLRRVAREAEACYRIGFLPDRPESGARELEVRVTHADLEVRSRTRYVAGTKAAGRRRSERERKQVALRSIADTSDVPLRLATLFFEDNAAGHVTTMYAAEIRFPPGTEGEGTALHTFEVPSPERFRFSTPVLTSELEETGGTPRPRVALSRTYREGEILYCQVQVYGAAHDPGDKLPRVTAHYELRRGDTPVRTSEPTRIRPERDGRLSRLVGLSLEGAATGNYTLVLTAKDEVSGQTITITEPFSIRPARASS